MFEKKIAAVVNDGVAVGDVFAPARTASYAPSMAAAAKVCDFNII